MNDALGKLIEMYSLGKFESLSPNQRPIPLKSLEANRLL